jgi:ApbE superfamily uncharacterized protein (UPF0280 family)
VTATMSARRQFLSGDRWHFQHGPIDIVIGANGRSDLVRAAHEAAWQRFERVLEELVAELPLLRAPVLADCPLQGAIARRMWQACHPLRAGFITPMAAVAGSVAQELVACYDRPGIDRAWVNNGGDVALHLAAGESLRVGLFADLGRLQQVGAEPLRLDGDFRIDAAMPVRGIATSGWRGRSFSLGIADSVTVLARTAAQADAAATVIANAVDADDVRIRRRPARELKDDSDLGSMLVTVDVPPLAEANVHQALRAGADRARVLRDAGHIHSAVLTCQGWFATDASPPRHLQQASAPAQRVLLPA